VSEQRREISALTGIRAVAALLVTVHHMGKLEATSWEWGEGSYGVGVFFALSGFLITYRYFGRMGGDWSFKEYWLRRVARIYPAYLVLLGIGMWIKKPVYSFWEWAGLLTLTHGYFSPTIWAGLNPISWSLTVEEGFYLLAPLVFIFCGGKAIAKSSNADAAARPWWLPLAKLLVFVALFGCLLNLIHKWWPRGQFLVEMGQVDVLSIFGRFPEFAIGMAGALLYKCAPEAVGRKIKKAAPWAGIAALIAAVLAVWVCLYIPNGMVESGLFRGINPIFLMVALSTTLVIGAILMGERVLNASLGNPAAEYLGKTSYCLYLLNAEVLFHPIHAMYASLLPSQAGNPVLFSVFIIMFAAAAYALVEKPAQRLLIELWLKKHTKPALAVRAGARIKKKPVPVGRS
jgi:peptidoglycan/LPS O-acetylase OafA/YrhL